MNKNFISLKKLNSIVINDVGNDNNEILVLTFNNNLLSLGYVLSKELYDTLVTLDSKTITNIAKETVENLKSIVGDDVKYNPMYPNFPKQVVEASNVELYINAILHYWSHGTFLPEYEKKVRSYAFEDTKLTQIQLASEEDFANVFTGLLSSKDSISELDTKIIQWFLDNYNDLIYPDTIEYKEISCIVGNDLLKKNKDISPVVKSGTDVMRVYAYHCEQDHTLSEMRDICFKSLSRSKRKNLVNALDKHLDIEETKRNPNVWVHMFHALHVGDYSKKVYNIAKNVRNNITVESFNSKVENAISNSNLNEVVNLLKQRPSMFGRRLDELFRNFNDHNVIVNEFLSVVNKIPNRVLYQIWGHFNTRNNNSQQSYIVPKGKSQYIFTLNRPLKSLKLKTIYDLITGIQNELCNRFNLLDELGNVYVDESLKNCPLPTQQRSASDGKFTVARGTRMPISGNKDTLRFFIYWEGEDIDLSGSFFDENMEFVNHISYMNLRDSNIKSYHSGDITQALDGASEFIDVDITSLIKNKIRYVAMNVNVFRGPTFAEHEKVYAGWMLRNKSNSNAIYDPKTVEQKVDLVSESKQTIPVIFDVYQKEAIWVDTNAEIESYSPNNVLVNKASISDVLNFYVNRNNKVSLYDLFTLHAESRGKLVDNREDADVVYDWNGDVTPYHINEINSEYV